jgi:cytochrome c oxidase subunit IV
MAHDHTPAPVGAHPANPSAVPGAHPIEHEHPTWVTYAKVAFILFVITAVEVSAYYIPAWENSRVYVPSMLIMSGLKFWIVVMFYMHIKYDHKLFRALFTGPLIIAVVTIVALMMLFGQIGLNFGG